MGLRGVVAIFLAFLLADLLGQTGVIIAVSALFISFVDFAGPLGDRVRLVGMVTLLGGLITLTAGIFGVRLWPMVISTTIITFLCGLALVYGSKSATLAMLLNVWYVIALPIAGSTALPAAVLSVLLGGCLILAEMVILAVLRREQPPPDLPAPDTPGTPIDIQSLISLESPIFRFSLVKALAVGLATVAGWLLIGGHPFWVTYAPLAIIRPDLHQTMVGGIQRVTGTVLGGITGFLLISFIEVPLLLELLFLAATFLMLATQKVSYTIFVTFLTIVLVIAAQLGGASFGTAGLERVAATALGVLIAFTVIILLGRILRTGRPDRPSSIRKYRRVMHRKKNT